MACTWYHQHHITLFQQFYFWLLSSFGFQVNQTGLDMKWICKWIWNSCGFLWWFIQLLLVYSDVDLYRDYINLYIKVEIVKRLYRDLPHFNENSVDIKSVLMCQLLHSFYDHSFYYIRLHDYHEVWIQDFLLFYTLVIKTNCYFRNTGRNSFLV